MSHLLNIDVYVDLICPWCLIGKRNLHTALANLSEMALDVAVTVVWRSLALLPFVPPEGWPFASFYRQRLGSEAAVQRRQAQVRAAAEAAGVSVAFENIRTFPNTRMAHLLLQTVQETRGPAAAEMAIDSLFDMYFCQGGDFGNLDSLLALADKWNFDTAVLRPVLRDGVLPPVDPALASAGVPLYVFNGSRTLAGLKSVSCLLDSMQETLAPSLQAIGA